MKPLKNRVYCKDCDKIKMLFKTEKKADSFIKFNSEDIKSESGYSPIRSYFCTYCGGWHITSKEEQVSLISKTEKIIEYYHNVIQKEEEVKQTKKEKEKEGLKQLREKTENEKVENIERQIIGFDLKEKESFFERKIKYYKDEIKSLNALTKTDIRNKEILGLRKELEVVYILRKKYGLKPQSKMDIRIEKEIEEWKIWAEKSKI